MHGMPIRVAPNRVGEGRETKRRAAGFTNGALRKPLESPMPRWMFVFPIALLLMAVVIVFAFNSTGPTQTQDTHVTEGGTGGSAGRKP